MLGLYGFRNFCGIKQSLSIAETLMPKLKEHYSNRPLLDRVKHCRAKVKNVCLTDENFSPLQSCQTKFRPIRYYVIKWLSFNPVWHFFVHTRPKYPLFA